MQENNYLGKERVGKLLLQFAIPSTLALIISCLYNIVDQIFVGNGIGYLGNAATGIVFPITVVGWGASVLFGDGMATLLSLSQGQGDTSAAGRSAANSIFGSFLSGVVIIAVCYALGDSVFYVLGATEATIDLTRDYGRIIFLMMPLAFVQNTMASIIRSDGSPKYSMAAMMVGAVINMIGDPVAIFVLDWGIKGAAIATILGQFVSFLICIAYLRRSRVFRLKAADFIPSWQHLKPVLPLGAGSFLTQLCIVATTIANNILLKSYGARSEYGPDIPLSAFVVIIKLFQIILNIACGITAGALPIMGYNYGAKLYSRVKETFKLVALSTLTVCVIATALFESVPLLFVRMFGTDGGELYTNFAVGCLRIYLSLVIFTCLQKACAMFLQSIGHAKAAVPLSVLRELYLSTSAVRQAVIAQEKALNMIADTGSCVIVGRAADYVLRNRENVVRIFIHAPKEYRVKKVMEMYGDTEQEGRKSIARSDSARGSYYRSISGHTWGDPHQYELSVDSSIGPEKTADLICGYVSHL